MKKVIRLTESDLIKIVRRVINEETTTKLPVEININLKLEKENYFLVISEVVKKSTNCEFIGNFRGESKKFRFTWNPSVPDKLSYTQRINFKYIPYTGTISEKAAIQLQNACENKKFVSTDKGDSSNYV